MRTRGLSLLELMLALTVVAIVLSAVARAVQASNTVQRGLDRARRVQAERIRTEDEIQRLIAGAELRGDGGAFVSPVPKQASGIDTTSDLGPGAGSLVLTTDAVPASSRFLEDTERPFEDLNRRFGPQGGPTEVALSTIPVGDAGNRRGLFLRSQRPPDDELSSGGEERVLDPHVRDIRFQFYDGSNWVVSWDSTDKQKGKLPQAVRVIYELVDDKTPRTLFVRLRMATPGAAS